MEITLIPKNHASLGIVPRSVFAGAFYWLFALLVVAAPAAAQTAPGPPAPSPAPPARPTRAASSLTILTSPPGADVRLRNDSEFDGTSPLELPWNWTGTYSVIVSGGGAATARGVVNVPSTGIPKALSDPPGLSARLVFRSLSYPGLNAFTGGRRARGAVLGLAATGGVAAAIRSHILYRNALNDLDSEASARARENKLDRNHWIGYAAAIWGVSAVDEWFSPRIDVVQATPQRVTFTAPSLSRGAVAWRALLLPGAGHEFAGRSGRGAVWMAGVLAGGAGALVADHDVRHQRRLLADATDALNNAPPSQKPALQQEVFRRADDLQTAEDLRRGFEDAALIFHGASFIDALTMSLTPHDGGPRRFSAVPRFGPGASSLALQMRF